MASIDPCDDTSPLDIDQARLRVKFHPSYTENNGSKAHSTDMLLLHVQSSECHECDLTEKCHWATLNDDRGVQILVDTKYPTKIFVQGMSIWGSKQDLCSLTEHFGEFGTYNLTVFPNDGETKVCQLEVAENPVNSNLPILYIFLAYMVLWMVYYGAKCAKHLWTLWKTDNLPITTEGAGLADAVNVEILRNLLMPPQKRRFRALDVFRGLSIVIMIFVNLGSGEYSFFDHSPWNGLTLADMVFPWFMFIMGVSMVLSMDGAIRRRATPRSLLLNVLRRSLILFLLGLFLNSSSNNDFRTLRIMGVLQRFSLTYLVVGILIWLNSYRRGRFLNETEEDYYYPRDCEFLTHEQNDDNEQIEQRFSDVKNLWLEWIIVLTVTAVHTCVTLLAPVPNCPSGYLGPGGLDLHGSYANCTGGIARYIDRFMLSENHMYGGLTCKELYKTFERFDPEGLFSTLTAILTVFLGVQCGSTLASFPTHRSRLIRWLLWSIICGLPAGILCKFSKNDGWIPVNKNLWSLSYVLAMASLSFSALAILYCIIDVLRWWNGAPFYHAGMNSIVLYLAHMVFGRYLPFSWKPIFYPNTHASALTMNVWATTLFVLIAIYLHHKKIYIAI